MLRTKKHSGQNKQRKAYKNACAVEEQIMGTVDAMGNASSKTLGLTSKLKALTLAAADLEHIHGLKSRALGLDKDLPIGNEMPVPVIRDLTEDKIKALHQDDEKDDAEPFVAESSKLALQDLADESDAGEDDAIVSTDSNESDDNIILEVKRRNRQSLAPRLRSLSVEELCEGNCPNNAWSYRTGGRDRAIDRSPIDFRAPGPPCALCSRGFFQGAI